MVFQFRLGVAPADEVEEAGPLAPHLEPLLFLHVGHVEGGVGGGAGALGDGVERVKSLAACLAQLCAGLGIEQENLGVAEVTAVDLVVIVTLVVFIMRLF